jgi:predicted nuclease of predicted toxin-antitoxin system
MKFLADMGISLRTVSWLRNAGYDAVHLRDEGLQRLPDDQILVKARTEGRILLTHVPHPNCHKRKLLREKR